jgi:DNA-binding MarR family transcriptional regulator
MMDNPEEYYGYWMRKVVRAMNNLFDEKLACYDLTASQFSLLGQLWHKDGLTQKEIQEGLGLRAASISGLVDVLVVKGMIIREQDQEDARVKRLYLTKKGSSLKSVCSDIILDIEGVLDQGFSEDERKIFISWMKKLYSNIPNV